MNYIVIKIRNRHAVIQNKLFTQPSAEYTRGVMLEHGVELDHNSEIMAEFDSLSEANKAADEWNKKNEFVEKTEVNTIANLICYGITTTIVAYRPETTEEGNALDHSGKIVFDDNRIFRA